PTGFPRGDHVSYNFAPGKGDFCVCTVKDGWLCATCKNQQNSEARTITTCAGEGCNNPLDDGKESRRICLWCDLPLIKRQHRSQNWDPHMNYNFGYTFEGKAFDDTPSKSDLEGPSSRRIFSRRRKHEFYDRQSSSSFRSRLTSVEKRRIERLLQPDDTG